MDWKQISKLPAYKSLKEAWIKSMRYDRTPIARKKSWDEFHTLMRLLQREANRQNKPLELVLYTFEKIRNSHVRNFYAKLLNKQLGTHKSPIRYYREDWPNQACLVDAIRDKQNPKKSRWCPQKRARARVNRKRSL